MLLLLFHAGKLSRDLGTRPMSDKIMSHLANLYNTYVAITYHIPSIRFNIDSDEYPISCIGVQLSIPIHYCISDSYGAISNSVRLWNPGNVLLCPGYSNVVAGTIGVGCSVIVHSPVCCWSLTTDNHYSIESVERTSNKGLKMMLSLPNSL